MKKTLLACCGFAACTAFADIKMQNIAHRGMWDKDVPQNTVEAIKRAVRDVYRGFLQPRAILHRLLTTRNLFDFGFYYRGIRSLLGHLFDFRKT